MNWLTNTVGTGAGDLYYWLGGGSALQAQNNALDAQLNSLNQQDYAPGGQIYNAIAATNGTAAADTAYQQVQQDAASSASSGSVKSQLQQAGQQGAAQGLSNLASGIQSATSGIFSTIAKLMPWQAWLAIGGGLFLWLDGWTWLKKKLA